MMPPPFLTEIHRGYELVQWFEFGPIEVSDPTGVFISTEHASLEGARVVVDEWLDAP